MAMHRHKKDDVKITAKLNILDKRNVTGTISDSRFNLFRIFDNFIADETYPFFLELVLHCCCF